MGEDKCEVIIVSIGPIRSQDQIRSALAIIANLGESYGHILGPSNAFGEHILPRAGALLDVQEISHVIAIETVDVFYKPMCVGSIIAKVKSMDKIKVLTVRPSSFISVLQRNGFCDLNIFEKYISSKSSISLSRELIQTTRPDLDSARVVISGGLGLGNDENIRLLYSLAEKLYGAVGASRAAVDAGYDPNDMRIG